MGSMNLKNLSVFLIKRIFAKGKVSLTNLAEWLVYKCEMAKNDKELANFSLMTSEGIYSNFEMLGHGLEICADFHKNNRVIEPILDSDEKLKTFNEFKKGNFSDPYEFREYDNIEWKFSEGARKKYLSSQIIHIELIES